MVYFPAISQEVSDLPVLGSTRRRIVFHGKTFRYSEPVRRPASGFYRWRRSVCSEVYCVNLALALPVVIVAGVVSGLIGVSGGIVKAPMLVLMFGVPMNIAVGSSAFMVGLTATGGFLGHLTAGHFDWKTALILTPGVFIGAQAGARMSVKADKAKMKRVFGYILAALGVFLVIRTALP